MNYQIRLLHYNEPQQYPDKYYGAEPEEKEEWIWQHPHLVVELLEQTSENTFRINHWAIIPDPEGPFTNPTAALSILESILPPPDYWRLEDVHLVDTCLFFFSAGEWKRRGLPDAKTLAEIPAEMDKLLPE